MARATAAMTDLENMMLLFDRVCMYMCGCMCVCIMRGDEGEAHDAEKRTKPDKVVTVGESCKQRCR